MSNSDCTPVPPVADDTELAVLHQLLIQASPVPNLFAKWGPEVMRADVRGILRKYAQDERYRSRSREPCMIVGLAIYEVAILRCLEAPSVAAEAIAAAVHGVTLLFARIVPEDMVSAGYAPMGRVEGGGSVEGVLGASIPQLAKFCDWWGEWAHHPDLLDVWMPEGDRQAQRADHALRLARDMLGKRIRERRPGRRLDPGIDGGQWGSVRSEIVNEVVSRGPPLVLTVGADGIAHVRKAEALAHDLRDLLMKGGPAFEILDGEVPLTVTMRPAQIDQEGAVPEEAERRLEARRGLERLARLEGLSARERRVLELSVDLGLAPEEYGGRRHLRCLEERGLRMTPQGFAKLWHRMIGKLRAGV